MNNAIECNMCRLCLCSGGRLRDIFEEIDTLDFMVGKTIEDLLQQKVKKESVYPWLVCHCCLEKLTEFRLFRLRCLECLFVFDNRVQKGDLHKAKRWKSGQEKKGCKEEEEYNNVPDEICNEATETVNPECTIRDNDMSSNVWKNGSSLGTIVASKLTANDGNEIFITDDAGLDPIGASAFEEREIGEHIKLENVEDNIHDAEIDTAMTNNEDIEITEHKVETYNYEPNWTLENVNEPHKEGSSECSHCKRKFHSERGLSIHLRAKHGSKSNKVAEMTARGTDPFSESEVLGHHVVLKECRIILTDILKGGTSHRKISMESAGEMMSKTSSDNVDAETAEVNGQGELELSNWRTLSNERENGNELISNENQEPFSQKVSLSDDTENQNMAKVTKKSGNRNNRVTFEEGEREIHSENLESVKDLEKMSGPSPSARQECTSDSQLFKSHGMARRSKRIDSRKHGYPADHVQIEEGSKKGSKIGLYVCNECLMSFTSKYNLHRHILSHSGKNPYSCSVFCEPFKQKVNSKVHKLTYSVEESHSCSICSKSFTQMCNLKTHMLIHSGEKPHSCLICHKSFTQMGTLKTHMLIHLGEKPYSCVICYKSFNRMDNLNTHMLIHSGEKPHSCLICHKSFTQMGTLKTHMLRHSGEKPQSCSVCHKSFTQMGTLKTHMLIHSGEKPHSCLVCQKSFNRMGNLKSHMLIHSGEKPHSCLICHKSFTHMCNLKTHILRHSGEKPHSCSVCHKSFTQMGTLKTHMLIHSGEKPHSCVICYKSFNRIHNLNTHMLIHSGEKPHSCLICHKSFTQMGTLKNHMMIHLGNKPHSCVICHKSFNRMGNLKTHMLIHSREKSHICGTCRKSFTHIRNLKTHMLIHSSEKSYS